MIYFLFNIILLIKLNNYKMTVLNIVLEDVLNDLTAIYR